MKKEKWIVFDLDDTVGDFAGAVKHVMGENHDYDLQLDALHNYNMPTHMGMNISEFYAMLEQNHVYRDMLPFLHWKTTIAKAHHAGWQIAFITARGMVENAIPITQSWLSRHSIHCDQLIVTMPGDEKWRVMPEGTLVVVEDSAQHARDYYNAPVLFVCLIDQPWNSQTVVPPGVYRGTQQAIYQKVLALVRSDHERRIHRHA